MICLAFLPDVMPTPFAGILTACVFPLLILLCLSRTKLEEK